MKLKNRAALIVGSGTVAAFALAAGLAEFAGPAGDTLDLSWHTIDGGGGTSEGGAYVLSGTIGQPDASLEPMTGGAYTLTGGFWVTPATPPVGVHATAWRSVRTHGGIGPLAAILDASAPGETATTEPRIGGIQIIEIDFDQAVTIVGGTVQVQNLTDGGSVAADGQTLINGDQTLELTFNTGTLPDQKCYAIDLAGMVQGTGGKPLSGDTDCLIRALEGDTDSNGDVQLADAILAFDLNLEPVTADNCRFDVDVNGNMELADAILAFDRNLHKAECP